MLVSLAVGVLLAVVSVPVAAVVTDLQIANGSARSLTEDLVGGEHQVVTTKDRATCGTVWHRSRVLLNPGRQTIISFDQSPDSAKVFRVVPKIIWLKQYGHARTASLWLVGWPVRSVYGVRRTGPPLATVQRVGMAELVVLGRSWSFPWIPYPLGLLANAFIYALLSLAVMAMLRWWRVQRRIRRRWCAACGYKLGEGVGTCPECGLVGPTLSNA